MSVAEKNGEVVGHGPFALQEKAVCDDGIKGSQRHIVGQEVGVRHPIDVANTQRIGPNGVLPYVGFGAWNDQIMAESHHFALLREHIVAIGVLQSVATITSGGHSLYDKTAPSVGTTYTEHGQFSESAVGLIGI